MLFHGEGPSGASGRLLKGLDHQGVRNRSLLLFFLSHLCRKFFAVILCMKGEACPQGGPLHSSAGPLPVPGLTQKGSDPLRSDGAWEAGQRPGREKAKALGDFPWHRAQSMLGGGGRCPRVIWGVQEG